MSPPAPCPHRDSCPCHGPTPLCYHGYYGPARGRPETRAAADGSATVVHLVTAEACRDCPATAPAREATR